MQYVDIILKQILNNFDFAYMFIINVLTYIIIKMVDYINGERKVPTWQKRVILIIATIIVTSVYLVANYPDIIILVNSAILAPVFWSWVLRPIFKKLGVGYKNIDDCLQ